MGELLPGSGKDPIAPGCSRQIKDWKALVITLQYKNRPGFIPHPDLPLLLLPSPLLPPTQGRADATHPASTAGRHNTAAGLVLAFLGGGGKKDGEGFRDGVATAARQWHLAGTCKLCGSGGWERSWGTHRGVPTYCEALCQGGKSLEASAEQMSGQERTLSVGPSDTKREHGSGTGRHHVLVAPAGPKRRLLHTQSIEQHGLTWGSS